MSDSESDSLESINQFDTQEMVPEPEEEQVADIREAVRKWKANQLQKNSDPNGNPRGLNALRTYVASSASLYYDLMDYLANFRHKEQNQKDALYRGIVAAMGHPASLTSHARALIEYLLERDLVEFPFTVEPKAVNTYAAKGMVTTTEFPEDE